MVVLMTRDYHIKYFLDYGFMGSVEVSEDEFFKIVQPNRSNVSRNYHPGNINRLDFLENGRLIAYRLKVKI